MNAIILRPHELFPEIKIKDSLRVGHMRSILKKAEGDQLKVLILNQGYALAIIKSLSETEATLELTSKPIRHPSLSKFPHIHLIVGLCRPPTLKKIFEHATSLGVSKFSIFKSDLSDKSYTTSKVFTSKIYEELFELGLCQSKLFYQLPELVLFPKLDELDLKNALVLDFPPAPSIKRAKTQLSSQNLTLLVGPERGFSERERTLFKDSGAQSFSLSYSTLRVEIATFCALSHIHESMLDLRALKLSEG